MWCFTTVVTPCLLLLVSHLVCFQVRYNSNEKLSGMDYLLLVDLVFMIYLHGRGKLQHEADNVVLVVNIV